MAVSSANCSAVAGDGRWAIFRNSRSVALGYVLKYGLGHDSIACSWEKNSPETIAMLCAWADRVIVVEGHMVEKIPQMFHVKLSVYDVGPDRWFNGLHPELIEILSEMTGRDPWWRPH